MCVAMPGKVIALKGNTATVDFSGNTVEAMSALNHLKIGDWVLVHAGCILQTVAQNEAEEMVDIFREIEQYGV